MPLHLIKLCVGVESIRELEDWIAEKARRAGSSGERRHAHVTRMMPKRAAEIVEGGSLFWVIKGQLSCRQSVLGIEPFTDGEGIGRCRLLLEPAVVPVAGRPYRPFQGWRYLDAEDAPADLGTEAAAILSMPDALRRELVALGLL